MLSVQSRSLVSLSTPFPALTSESTFCQSCIKPEYTESSLGALGVKSSSTAYRRCSSSQNYNLLRPPACWCEGKEHRSKNPIPTQYSTQRATSSASKGINFASVTLLLRSLSIWSAGRSANLGFSMRVDRKPHTNNAVVFEAD